MKDDCIQDKKGSRADASPTRALACSLACCPERLVSPCGPRRRRTNLRLETLENRLNPSTYYWTALGDGQTWNDPMNWAHFVPYQSMAQTGVPTPYSDVVFPAISTLPMGASTTINFNFSYLFQPLDSLSINNSYTFEGTPVTIEQSLSVSNPFTSSSTTTAIVELSGSAFAPARQSTPAPAPPSSSALLRPRPGSSSISRGSVQDRRRSGRGRHPDGDLPDDRAQPHARPRHHRRRVSDAR